ncbi:uncharacterized protein LOC116350388 [Contarinia nasturtii]|uniref:uncharacterized protein LOC116350388 n=1 Tax=Contarinia nasturtii TaxID=265458 RepID=UPI0012D4BFEA|nr:uncharacterized protein LOC116350388 [Contarinia nasturtii]
MESFHLRFLFIYVVALFQFIDIYTCKKLGRLNIWFPNVVELELTHVKLVQPKSLEVKFDRLKTLAIHQYEELIESLTIDKMLRLNPQLHTLVLRSEFDLEFLQSIGENLTHLEVLEVWAPVDRFYNFGDEKVRFENVKKFTLSSQFEWGEFIVNVPFEFPKLRYLKFDGFNEFKGQLMNFIKLNRDVEQLHLVPNLESWDDLDINDCNAIVTAMPKLNELEFCGDTFTHTELVAFLALNKSLNKVRLWFIEPPIDYHFRCTLQKNWDLTTRVIEHGCWDACTVFALELNRKD